MVGATACCWCTCFGPAVRSVLVLPAVPDTLTVVPACRTGLIPENQSKCWLYSCSSMSPWSYCYPVSLQWLWRCPKIVTLCSKLSLGKRLSKGARGQSSLIQTFNQVSMGDSNTPREERGGYLQDILMWESDAFSSVGYAYWWESDASSSNIVGSFTRVMNFCDSALVTFNLHWSLSTCLLFCLLSCGATDSQV